jgi:hypothetical protein
MLKKVLLLTAAALALASAVSADWPIPPCAQAGTCKADVR